MVGTKSKIKGAATFIGRWGIQGVTIQGDNSTGHCFVISDSVTINSFK